MSWKVVISPVFSLTQEGRQIFKSVVEYYPPEFLGIREDDKANKII